MDIKHNVIIFAPKIRPKGIIEIEGVYSANSEYQFITVKNAEEANQIVGQNGHGILLFAITGKPELKEVVSFLKYNVRGVRRGTVKVGGFNLTSSFKVDSILKKYGCNDLLDEFVKTKVLEHKITLWSKSIGGTIEKIRSKRTNNDRIEVKEPEQQKNPGDNIKLVDPLQFTSDCWLVGRKSDVRFVMGHWIIELVGPGPYVGRWDEVKSEKDSSNQYWEWVPMHEEIYLFIEHKGRWVYRGKKPEFQNESNKWQFVSPSPTLFFVFDGGSKDPLYRFKYSAGELQLAKNSKYAIGRKEMLIESADPKLVLKAGDDKTREMGKKSLHSDKQEEEKNKKVASGEQEIDVASLQKEVGKNEPENVSKVVDLTSLRQKDTASGTDGKSSGPQLGVFEEEDDATNVEIGEDGVVRKKMAKKNLFAPAIGKIDKAEVEHEGDIGGEYSGKSETDKIAGHLKGRVKKAEEGLDTSASAKSETEKLNHGPMIGKLKDGQKDIDGNMSGKAHTEELDHSPYSSLESKGGTSKMGTTEFGKGSTDKIDAGPLKGKLKDGQKDIDGNMSGKAHTEELDHSPYSSLESKGGTSKMGTTEFGKGSTDKIDAGPLKGSVGESKRHKEGRSGLVGHEEKYETYGGGEKSEKQLNEWGEIEHDSSGNAKTGKASKNKKSGPLVPHLNLSDVQFADELAAEIYEDLEKDEILLEDIQNWSDDFVEIEELDLSSIDLSIRMSQDGDVVNAPTSLVELDDVVDNILVVRIPVSTYQEGIDVSLKVNCFYSEKSLSFNMRGKVIEILDDEGEEEPICNVELSEYKSADLDRLQNIMIERQQNITDFFKAAKGQV